MAEQMQKTSILLSEQNWDEWEVTLQDSLGKYGLAGEEIQCDTHVNWDVLLPRICNAPYTPPVGPQATVERVQEYDNQYAQTYNQWWIQEGLPTSLPTDYPGKTRFLRNPTRSESELAINQKTYRKLWDDHPGNSAKLWEFLIHSMDTNLLEQVRHAQIKNKQGVTVNHDRLNKTKDTLLLFQSMKEVATRRRTSRIGQALIDWVTLKQGDKTLTKHLTDFHSLLRVVEATIAIPDQVKAQLLIHSLDGQVRRPYRTMGRADPIRPTRKLHQATRHLN